MKNPQIGIMVDLETLSTGINAVVLQIGMIAWDLSLDDGGYIDELHSFLPVEPQLRLGREVSASTLNFWFQQGAEVRRVFEHNLGTDEVELTSLLRHFVTMFNRLSNGKDYEVWARGPQFDLVLLESLLRTYDIPVPWEYNRPRDLRTLMSLARVSSEQVERPESWLQHNAHHDCKFQIACYRHAMKQLSRG